MKIKQHVSTPTTVTRSANHTSFFNIHDSEQVGVVLAGDTAVLFAMHDNPNFTEYETSYLT